MHSHGGSLRRRRVVYQITPAKNPSVPAYNERENVVAGHSRRGSLRVSNAGGSRRSYKNGRVDSAVAGSEVDP